MFNFKKAATAGELFSGFTKELERIVYEQLDKAAVKKAEAARLQQESSDATYEAERASVILAKINEIL